MLLVVKTDYRQYIFDAKEVGKMREINECELRSYLAERIAKACRKNQVDSVSVRRLLKETVRNGSANRDRCHCCTLLFIVYLCFLCEDVSALIEDLRGVIGNAYHDVETE